MSERTTAGERLKVTLAWIVVLIPAAWGVAQVVSKSAALFR
jgi:hypothetical protein